MVSPQDIGMWGEHYCAARLRESGWVVDRNSPADLRAIDSSTGRVLHIEVKTARRGADKKWRATLQKQDHTSADRADLVIFLCISHSLAIFVLPKLVFAGRRALVVTSEPTTYAGKLAPYRVNTLETLS